MASDYEIRRLQREIENCQKQLERSFWREVAMWFFPMAISMSLLTWAFEKSNFGWSDIVFTAGSWALIAPVMVLAMRWMNRRLIRRYERELTEALNHQ